MTVESVLRYLGKQWLAINQYRIGEQPNHFFKCSEVKEKIGEREFRYMECSVTQYMVVTMPTNFSFSHNFS